jgi:hypothetical protein
MLRQARLSSLAFFRRHHRGLPLVVGLALEQARTAGRLAREGLRYCFASSGARGTS